MTEKITGSIVNIFIQLAILKIKIHFLEIGTNSNFYVQFKLLVFESGICLLSASEYEKSLKKFKTIYASNLTTLNDT